MPGQEFDRVTEAVDAGDWTMTPAISVPVQTVFSGGPGRRFSLGGVRVDKAQARSWRIVLVPLGLLGERISDASVGIPECVTAVVTWGFDTVTQSAEIDWPICGGHLEVWGDNVRVEMVVPLTIGNLVIGPTVTPGAINGMCAIVPGATANGLRPTRSIYTDGIGPGAVVGPIAVPLWARSVRWHQVFTTDPGNAPSTLNFTGTMDIVGLNVVQNTPAGFSSWEGTWPGPDGLTLCPQTRYLYVTNSGPFLETVWLRLEFVLDLGG